MTRYCSAWRRNKRTGEWYKCFGKMEDMGIIVHPDDPLHPRWVYQCKCGFHVEYFYNIENTDVMLESEAYANLYEGVFGEIRKTPNRRRQ